MHQPDILTPLMPATMRELIYHSGRPRNTVIRWVRRMQATDQCHISSYRPPSGPGKWSPIFAAGPGVDATEPPPLTNTQYSRNHYSRKARRIAALFAPLGITMGKPSKGRYK